MSVSSWPGRGTGLGEAPGCWLGSASQLCGRWRASGAKGRNLRKGYYGWVRSGGSPSSSTQFLINRTQCLHLFFQAFGGRTRLFTFLKHCPKEEWMLFGRRAPWDAEATLSLADPNPWISQSVHVTPSGGRGAATRPFSAPKTHRFPTSACRSVVWGGWRSLPCLGQDFQLGQEFPPCLVPREK